MKHRDQLLPLLLLLPALFACKLFDKSEDKSASSGTPGTGTPLLPAAPTGASPGLPAGKSAVPTNAEWGSAPEITVRGSSALGCSTKALREWLRVSCSGKNDSGGTPTTVTVESGSRSEMFTFASNGVTSLVMPFRDGTDASATFGWTDKSHRFQSKWPHGAPQPPIYGEFIGAATPSAQPVGKRCNAHSECAAGEFCLHSQTASTPTLICTKVQFQGCKKDADCKNPAARKCAGPSAGSVPSCMPG